MAWHAFPRETAPAATNRSSGEFSRQRCGVCARQYTGGGGVCGGRVRREVGARFRFTARCSDPLLVGFCVPMAYDLMSKPLACCSLHCNPQNRETTSTVDASCSHSWIPSWWSVVEAIGRSIAVSVSNGCGQPPGAHDAPVLPPRRQSAYPGRAFDLCWLGSLSVSTLTDDVVVLCLHVCGCACSAVLPSDVSGVFSRAVGGRCGPREDGGGEHGE